MQSTSNRSAAASAPSAAPTTELSRREREHYLFLQKSFEEFNLAAARMQTAFSSLEHKFQEINRELERKNAELQKVVSEKEELTNYLQNIMESLTTGVVVTDLKGKVTLLNHSAAVLSGAAREAAVGRGLQRLLPELGRMRSSQGKRVRIRGRVIDVFGSQVRGKEDAIIGTVYILRDVTRIERFEEMEKRTEKLAAMGDLAANIAHEIRNPLGSIELFASLLLKEAEREKDRDRLIQIISSVKNVDSKISNLLLFTRKQTPLMKRISLHRVLKEVLLFSRQLIEKGGITLAAHFAEATPFIKGDPEMLKQVFLNILLNAMQAMPDGGRLDVRTAADENHIEIRICDTGEGIPPENLPRIFDPFFSTRERGAGLGLAIVHTIIDIHEGSIAVESPPVEISGTGTVFTIAFPLIRRKDG